MPITKPLERILLVDDDPNILSSYLRQLRKHFHLQTAESAQVALTTLEQEDSDFAVMVVDQQMPHMDGITLLEKVSISHPKIVKLMLTGNADQQTAIKAINQGQILRFLTKPCLPEDMITALNAGIEQYRLVMAEKQLIRQTLRGSVQILTEILSMVDPDGFGKTTRIRQLAKIVCKKLNEPQPWVVDLAAMLCPLGMVTVPAELIARQRKNQVLNRSEKEVLLKTPLVTHQLLSHIPRLENVAHLVKYHHQHFDGSRFPSDGVRGEQLPLGSRILKTVHDVVDLEVENLPAHDVVKKMRMREGWYDPVVLDCLLAKLATPVQGIPVRISIWNVQPGHVLADDVLTKQNSLLIRKGQILTPTIKERLRNYLATNQVNEFIQILQIQDKSVNLAEPLK